MSGVQKLGVPVFFFFYNNCYSWFDQIVEGKGIRFYLQPTQSLGEGILPWAIFRTRIFLNYLSQK